MFTTPSRMRGTCALLLGSLCFSTVLHGQHMVREWNEVLLQSIRDDLARPTVHARNLHHWSMAVYDAWAAYDSIAEPCLVDVDLPAIEDPVLRREAQEEAINYASFRILWTRFANTPGGNATLMNIYQRFLYEGGQNSFQSTDYLNDGPRALGAIAAACAVRRPAEPKNTP